MQEKKEPQRRKSAIIRPMLNRSTSQEEDLHRDGTLKARHATTCIPISSHLIPFHPHHLTFQHLVASQILPELN